MIAEIRLLNRINTVSRLLFLVPGPCFLFPKPTVTHSGRLERILESVVPEQEAGTDSSDKGSRYQNGAFRLAPKRASYYYVDKWWFESAYNLCEKVKLLITHSCRVQELGRLEDKL